MRLVKIREGGSSNTTRPVQTSELLYRYIFGDTTPVRFTPGVFYNQGQFCYVISKQGTPVLYMCTMSGVYDSVNNKCWVLSTLRSDVQNILNQVLGVEDPNRKVLFDVKVFTSKDFIVDTNSSITLPIAIEDGYNVSVYVDGKYKSGDLGQFIITDNVITFTNTLVVTDNIVVYVKIPKNHNAKLFLHYDVLASGLDIDTNSIIFDISGIESRFSTVCNLYSNGILVYPSSYTTTIDEDNDKIIITMNDAMTNAFMASTFVLSTISSRSPYLMVYKETSEYLVSNEVERYRLELDTPVHYEMSDSVFCSGYNVPSNKVSIRGDIASITDKKHYASVGNTFIIVDYTYWYIDNVLRTSAIVAEKNEKNIPIPLLNLRDDADIIVFKGSGVHIGENRYYNNNGYINIYPHDNSIVEGDRIFVRRMNNDVNMIVKSHIVEVDGVTVTLPETVSEFNEVLLFYTDGRYIGGDKYNITNNQIVFKNELDSLDGMINVVYNYYTEGVTHTIEFKSTNQVTDINKIRITSVGYNPETDDILLFNNTSGLYIDQSKYIVSSDGIISIVDTATFNDDDTFDVVIIRDLDYNIYTSSVGIVKNNMQLL